MPAKNCQKVSCYSFKHSPQQLQFFHQYLLQFIEMFVIKQIFLMNKDTLDFVYDADCSMGCGVAVVLSIGLCANDDCCDECFAGLFRSSSSCCMRSEYPSGSELNHKWRNSTMQQYVNQPVKAYVLMLHSWSSKNVQDYYLSKQLPFVLNTQSC